MSVFQRIVTEIHEGMPLYTPVTRAQFEILSIDRNKGMLVFHVGTKTRIKVPRACWNGIPNFLRGKDWVRIGARHDVAPSGTLEEYLDKFWSEGKTHASAANYVASVLDYLGIVVLDRNRPSKIRLNPNQP